MHIQQNKIAFSALKLRKREMKPLVKNKNHPVHGFDTETYKGYAKIICDETGKYVHIKKIEDALLFLTRKSLRAHHNFFYNIRFDFQAIIKWLPLKNIRELYETSTTEYKEFKIKYIPKKLFRIILHKHSYSFYDAFVFYQMKLEKAAMKHLGKQKNKENIDRERLNIDLGYWKERYSDIVRYCISDAQLTCELGEYLQREFKHKLQFLPQKYTSRASVSKEYLRKHCKIPNIIKIDRAALAYAFNAYHGGRFEILEKGHFDYTTLLDLHSAYPYHIANLIDVTDSEWKRVREIDQDATYGFYMTKVSIPYQKFAPLAFRSSSGVVSYPIGDFVTFLTKEEIEAYADYSDIKIINGWETIIKEPTKPFKEVMETLYRWKQETPKTDFRYELVKRLLNSPYGTFYEKIQDGKEWKTGILFNPIYASVICANCRIQLFEEAKRREKDVLGFATDSILLRGKHEIHDNGKMGSWGIDSEGETTILRSGMYEIGETLKSRGLSKARNLKTKYGEYHNFFEYIRDKPDMKKYKVIISRPVNLGEIMQHTKTWTIEDMNVWKDFEYIIDINSDQKRTWLDHYDRGGELFERSIASIPLMMEDMEGQKESATMRRAMKHRERMRAKERREDDVADSLDSQCKTQFEKDGEIMNEMTSPIRREMDYWMEGRR